MTRICCNTADDQPHAEGCTYAIGNSLNRPCATHSIRGCLACRREAEGAHAAPAEPSIHAPARETGPFYVGDDGKVAMMLAGGRHAVARLISGSPVGAQEIADALNIMHAASAGTAGIVALARSGDDSRDRFGDALAAFLCEGASSDCAGLERELSKRLLMVVDAGHWAANVNAADAAAEPIRMVLHCPRCGLQHVDQPEPESGWTNPPLCHGCGCIWRPAEVATNGVPGLTATGTADNWFPGSATSLDARIAVMDVLAAVRDDFTAPDAAAALDEAMRRVTELCGTGLPDSPASPFADDLPTFTVNVTGVTTQAQARRQAEHRHRHDLAGILAPFPEPERFTRRPCGEGLECPGDRSPFELRGGGLFQDGKRIASCETPEAGWLLIAALAVAESAASLDHPVEQLRAYLAERVGSDRVDHEALDEARRYMDASGEPYRAAGQTVYQGKRRVAHCPAADGYNDTRQAVRDAESIALALNAVADMTCPHCADLGNSHAPDCPAAPPAMVVNVNLTGDLSVEAVAQVIAQVREQILREVQGRMARRRMA